MAGAVGGEFVGRTREIKSLNSALASDQTRVVAVGGPGGIGKSTLVTEFCRHVRGAGIPVVRVDGAEFEPSSQHVLGAVAAAAGANEPTTHSIATRMNTLGTQTVLVIENYERLRLADEFVRDQFAGDLPRSTLVILVGRDRLVMPWFADPSWEGRVETIWLEAFDERSAQVILTRIGLSSEDSSRIFRATGGHPLAIRLTADLIARGADPTAVEAPTDTVIASLAAEYLETIPEPATREALEALSTLRRITESSVRAILPDRSPTDVVDRVRALPFTEVKADGLVIHDVVRDAVARRLSQIAPDRYRQYRQAAWAQLRAELDAAPRAMLWRHTADLLHLLEAAELRDAFFPPGRQPLVVTPASHREAAAIDTIIAAHCKPAEASALRHWWTHAPHTFSVCRDEGDVVGVRIVARRDDLSPELVAADPVAATWSRDNKRLPSGAESLMFRRLLDIEVGEANSASRASFGLDLKRTYMELRPRLRYLYNLGADPNEMQWAPMLGFDHRTDLAVELGDQTFHTWRLDMGPDSVDGWLTQLAADAVGITTESRKVFDETTHQFARSDGNRVDLTPLENKLLAAIWRREGRPVSRADLLAEVWGYEHSSTSNVIDTAIAAVRRKLGPDRNRIETVRGVGYRHNPDAESCP